MDVEARDVDVLEGHGGEDGGVDIQ